MTMNEPFETTGVDPAPTVPVNERPDAAGPADEFDRDELAKLRAENQRLRAERAAATGRGNVPESPDDEPPPEPTHVALLANGERHEYFGAHPTHVADGDTVIPVLSVHPLSV